MKIRRCLFLMMIFVMSFGLAQRAVAQTFTPDALVKDLYTVHGQDSKTNKDRILSGKSRRYIDKYFDKNLADLIWKDLTTDTGYAGVIDFDPFYNTQDPDIKNLTVGAPKITGTKASVIVRFTNSGVKVMLSYQLVKQNSQWKISDIRYDRKSSLLGYFKEDAANR